MCHTRVGVTESGPRINLSHGPSPQIIFLLGLRPSSRWLRSGANNFFQKNFKKIFKQDLIKNFKMEAIGTLDTLGAGTVSDCLSSQLAPMSCEHYLCVSHVVRFTADLCTYVRLTSVGIMNNVCYHPSTVSY